MTKPPSTPTEAEKRAAQSIACYFVASADGSCQTERVLEFIHSELEPEREELLDAIGLLVSVLCDAMPYDDRRQAHAINTAARLLAKYGRK